MEEVHLTSQQFHAAPGALTIDQLEAALRGEIQVYVNENVHPMQLNRKELAAYERAKQRRFVVEEEDSRLLDEAYHQYCAAAQICWVKIVYHPQGDGCHINEEHATVWYDFFRLRHALTSDALQKVQRCFERARPGVYREARMDLRVDLGHGIVPEYTSEKLAIALWEIFDTPHTHTSELFQQHFPERSA